MPISKKDALAIHKVIHSGADSVKLQSGVLTPVIESKGCRSVKVSGVNAMEQNKKKVSKYAEQAKKGAKITWFIEGMPWGVIVDGVIEKYGKAIIPDDTVSTGSASVASKAKAKAKATPKGGEPPTTKNKKEATVKESTKEDEPPTKKTKTSSATASSSKDPLCLSQLFTGKGHGSSWEPILRPVIEGLPNAASFIGPSRDKRLVPVRELTFQALKPNPPSGWRVVSFGQSPYPRIESATGIAHFDNAVKSWNDSRFGTCLTMRCIIKAAAMDKYHKPKSMTMPELRDLLKANNIVGPSEWFQAMLTQGVLFMNAACTLLPPEDKSIRAGEVVDEHLKFWHPVLEAVVDAILDQCEKQDKAIVFAWWGGESLKTKRALTSFKKYPKVKVLHVEHKNPAAMKDAFCDPPNIFDCINKALKKLDLGTVDWLPSVGWQGSIGRSLSHAEEMGDFMMETQELHKLYLERLKDGLDNRGEELADITGVMSKPLVDLKKACKPLSLERAAEASTSKAEKMKRGKLTKDEAAAIHLYTTNFLYKKLNEALRDKDRTKVTQYFLYLRLLITALRKLPICKKDLYRGVALDLSSQYPAGAEVTWWALSSCTPDLKVANSFGGGSTRTLFIIKSRTSVGIRDLSEYQSEEEFILAPGTRLQVTDVKHTGKLIEIFLKELDLPNRVQ